MSGEDVNRTAALHDLRHLWHYHYVDGLRVTSEERTMRFDFDTWLMQTYGMKTKDLNKKALGLAKKEYVEEYPKPGESEITLKTYPFKKYLDSTKGNSYE